MYNSNMITLIKEDFFPLKFKCIFENIPDDVNTLCEKFYILNMMTLIGLSRVLQILFILTFIKFIDDINKINSSHNFYIVF